MGKTLIFCLIEFLTNQVVTKITKANPTLEKNGQYIILQDLKNAHWTYSIYLSLDPWSLLDIIFFFVRRTLTPVRENPHRDNSN